MGQILNRISTRWSDQKPSSIRTENNLIKITPIITKRKYFDQENFSRKKRKLLRNDNNLSCKRTKISSDLFNTSIISHSLLPMTLFKCQLCSQYFSNKDHYLDHMIICAIQHHASIKIVRAKTDSIQL